MIKVSAPGKICIAGEWAVLDIGNPAIVSAVDKKVFAEIQKSKDGFIHISIEDFGIQDLKASFDGDELKFERDLTEKEQKDVLFFKSAVESMLKYFNNIKAFKIKTWGEGVTGFGSSAASTVAVVAGLFKVSGEDIQSRESKERIYKLSAIAHYLAQDRAGSGFDIAASTFGGTLVYRRFDPEWLVNQFEQGKKIKEIVEAEWPGFYIEPIEIPEDFNLLIGWTGKSSSTSEMMKQMNKWKEKNMEEYKRIIGQIKDLVEQLIKVWKVSNKEKILELARRNEDYLRELGNKSGVDIETEVLAKLSEIANRDNGAGKLSGAGGGDYGIAITFNKEDSERIKREWEENGIKYVDTVLLSVGVKEC